MAEWYSAVSTTLTPKPPNSLALYQPDAPFQVLLFRYVFTTTQNRIVPVRNVVGTAGGKLYVAKLDAAGDILWEKVLRTGGEGIYVLETAQGEFLIRGRRDHTPTLTRTDRDGNVLWGRELEDVREAYSWGGGTPVVETENGGFLLLATTKKLGAGPGTDADINLVSIDGLGAVVSQTLIGGPRYESGAGLVRCSDGGYLIVGTTESFGEGARDLLLLRVGQGRVEIP